MDTHKGIGQATNQAMTALSAVSGFNHYTVQYFEWKAGYDMAVATFHDRCQEIRQAERDPALRNEMYEDAIDLLDHTIIMLTDEHFPKDKDGNWSEAEEASPAIALVVSNDTIVSGDGGSSIVQPEDTGAETILTEEPPVEQQAVAS